MKRKWPTWVAVSLAVVVSGTLVLAAQWLIVEPDGAPSAPVLTASRPGYGGEVTVRLTLTASGAVETLSVETPNETDGLGKRASEEAFTRQFIDKRAPFAYGKNGIEALSGATVTSNAVLEALNSAAVATS